MGIFDPDLSAFSRWWALLSVADALGTGEAGRLGPQASQEAAQASWSPNWSITSLYSW